VADPALVELADICGVATRYHDWRGRLVDVREETLIAVLHALGVDAHTPEARRASLDHAHRVRWRQVLPPTVVQRSGSGAVVAVHCRHGDAVSLLIECEDGTERTDVEQLMHWVEPVEVDGELRGEATFRLPADLPAGWHQLLAQTGHEAATATLVVAPASLEDDDASAQDRGVAVQLYAARSAQSWGMGDLGDLVTLVRWTGERGGSFVLVSPLAAAAPAAPIEPSPYYPATRRFTDPIYLRVATMPEYAAAGWGTRQRIVELRDGLDVASDGIDRDRIWTSKRAAFALLWPVARSDPMRVDELAAYRAREGADLERFATWCALAERYGVPWQQWPAGIRNVDLLATDLGELANRVQFYCWLQMCCDEQLAMAEAAARESGMRVGVIHDLPVGVRPGGADTWAFPDLFAVGVHVGAPADGFNQQGQDWQQPPWRPDRLAATGYAAYRDLLRAAFRHAGGLRVDHVLGLFRLWWIPAGNSAADGTYVRCDADAMLGILTLEAQRAGAVVIGEDLGTIEPGVRDALADRGILGSTVMWFETDHAGVPIPPEHWRPRALATVTTHDLPTTAGLLELSHVDLRARLGLLDNTVDDERLAEAHKRDGWLALAADRGLLPGVDEAATGDDLAAMHALLMQSPCRLVAVAVPDLVGDPRQPNQPGTTDEYPNWCLPLARRTPDGSVVPVTLDEALETEQAQRLVQIFTKGVRQGSVR
jgi:4-alpha-glucanotransferase